MSLEGYRAAITGASSGIGRATAILLGEAGANVALLGRNPEQLELTRRAALDAGANEVVVEPADVRDLDAMEAAAARISTTFGGLDGLVHAAGINAPTSLQETALSEWCDVIAVNLTGTFVTCKAFIPQIRQSEQGSIVLLSSVQSRLGGRSSQYAASKAGVEGLMRSFAKEASADKVRVNAVAPGGTETPFAQRYWSSGTRDRLTTDTLIGRVAAPNEVAEAIAFLLSPKASYITGSTVHVNGGLYVD